MSDEARLQEMKASQTLGLAQVVNARELGGYATEDGRVVRRKVLLRSGTPTTASEADRARLRDVYHVTRVLDFRMDFELDNAEAQRGTAVTVGGAAGGATEPHPLEFATTVRVPILNEPKMLAKQANYAELIAQGMSMLQLMIMAVDMGMVGPDMYIEFLEDDWGKRGYKSVFDHILEMPADEAILYHCTQGKDRTGLATLLILDTLGVRDELTYADYLLTNVFNVAIIEREQQQLLAAGIAPERLDDYMLSQDKVFPATLDIARDHLQKTYGSVWGYVHEVLGIDEGARAELRAKYLEEA